VNKTLEFFKKSIPLKLDRSFITASTGFLRNLFWRRIFNKTNGAYPLFVTWLVTFDCNVYCRFCSTHSLKKQFPEALSEAKALEVAEEIGRSGVWTVAFTGGEVLMWPHLFGVIRCLKSYGKRVYIVTNGLLLESVASQIVEAKVDGVVISIDAVAPGEHDYLRKSEGLFEKLVAGIKRVKELRGPEGPVLKSMTVVSKRNLAGLNEILAQVEALVDVSSVQPITNSYDNSPHNQSDKAMDPYMFGPEQEAEVREQMDRFIQHNPGFDNRYVRAFADYWFNKDTLVEAYPCWSPFLRLQIFPDGGVYHCTANDRFGKVGDLTRMSLLECWNSQEMLAQRECIRSGQNKCICWTQDSSFNAFLASLPGLNSLPVLGALPPEPPDRP